MSINSKEPLVIGLDIETSPIKGYTWTHFDANVLKVIENSQVISVAWKKLGEENVKVKCLADYKTYKKGQLDDEALIRDTWTLLDKADVIYAHHGDGFDLKKLFARFVFYGLNAPSPFKSIDTLKVAKRKFLFDGNSLNSLGQYLGVGKKLEHQGFGLWLKCIEDGDPKAWAMMKAYNEQDVILLEQVYLKLRPFIANHPNLNMLSSEPISGEVCPSCRSTKMTKRGFSITRTGRRQRYQCGDCASWSLGNFEKVKGNVLSSDED